MKERLIWGYALLGGAVAWMTHLLATYAIGEWACVLEGTFFVFLGVSSAGWMLILLSLGCLATSLGSVLVSMPLKNSQASVSTYIGRFGIFSGIIFSIAVLAQSAPIFTLLYGC